MVAMLVQTNNLICMALGILAMIVLVIRNGSQLMPISWNSSFMIALAASWNSVPGIQPHVAIIHDHYSDQTMHPNST